MRLMLVAFAVVLLLIVDFSWYKGHYTNELARVTRQMIDKLRQGGTVQANSPGRFERGKGKTIRVIGQQRSSS